VDRAGAVKRVPDILEQAVGTSFVLDGAEKRGTQGKSCRACPGIPREGPEPGDVTAWYLPSFFKSCDINGY
jgi:hypothetical protein